jgi:hypothetical protein
VLSYSLSALTRSLGSWDAEIFTSHGWIEVVGHADRAAFDLAAHSDGSGLRLDVYESWQEANWQRVSHCVRAVCVISHIVTDRRRRSSRQWTQPRLVPPCANARLPQWQLSTISLPPSRVRGLPRIIRRQHTPALADALAMEATLASAGKAQIDISVFESALAKQAADKAAKDGKPHKPEPAPASGVVELTRDMLSFKEIDVVIKGALVFVCVDARVMHDRALDRRDGAAARNRASVWHWSHHVLDLRALVPTARSEERNREALVPRAAADRRTNQILCAAAHH